jgi:PAS domain S-box-containing protein
MKKKALPEDASSTGLRSRAERRLENRGGNISEMSTRDVQALVHELEIHQAELEIQNEELREAQLELARTRDLYLDLYELAPVGYFTLDRRRVIRQANLAGAGLLRVDREKLIGTLLSKWLVPEDRDACYLFVRDVLEAGTTQNCTLRFLREDGSTFWAGLEGVAVRDAGRVPKQLRVTLSDISGRVAAEQAAKKAEEELRNLNEVLEERVQERTAELHDSRERALLRNESVPHMVWSIFSNGIGEYFNRRTMEYLGKTTEEMERLRWLDVVHPDDADKAAGEWASLAGGDREGFSELRIRRGVDGAYRWHIVQAVPMQEADGRIVRWLGTCTDIHERKLAEEALKDSQRSLREHGKSLEQKNLALREILGQLEVEKRQIREDMVINIRESVFPILDRLASTEENRLYIDMLRRILRDLADPFGRRLAEESVALTAREKEVCRMVYGGLSSKDISGLLNISLQTVEKHRKNIRKKLGLVASGATLGTYLSRL